MYAFIQDGDCFEHFKTREEAAQHVRGHAESMQQDANAFFALAASIERDGEGQYEGNFLALGVRSE